MSSVSYRCKEEIRAQALRLGAHACGFASAGPVDAHARELYESWISRGRNATMEYCSRYPAQRADPRLLLEGARTVISCAFNYHTPSGGANPRIAEYARGADYHHVVKSRLASLGEYVTGKWGGETRALADTAPIRERYWAQRCGIGFVGVNNQLIIPGAGSMFFLGELLWTGTVEPDTPREGGCAGCMACVRACPGGALDGKGGCDASRCVSYLTIEHRGELLAGAALGGMVYGCDVCQRVCPHNSTAPLTRIAEFIDTNPLLLMSERQLRGLTLSQWRRLTRNSAMSRAGLRQLLRNIDAL